MLSAQSTRDLPPGAQDADPRLPASAAAGRPPPPQSAPPARQPARQPHISPEPLESGLDDATMMQLVQSTTLEEATRHANMGDEKLMAELEDKTLARRMQLEEDRRARRERGEPDEEHEKYDTPPESPGADGRHRRQHEARTEPDLELERQPPRRDVVEQLREANARGGVVNDYIAEEAEAGLRGRLAGEPDRTGPVPIPRPPASAAPPPDARPPEPRAAPELEPETPRHVPERPQVVNVSGNDVDEIERRLGGLALADRDADPSARREAPKPKDPPSFAPPSPAPGPPQQSPSERDAAPNPHSPTATAPRQRTPSAHELPPGPSASAPVASAGGTGAEEEDGEEEENENEDSAQFAERISRILAHSEAPPARGREELEGECKCERET